MNPPDQTPESQALDPLRKVHPRRRRRKRGHRPETVAAQPEAPRPDFAKVRARFRSLTPHVGADHGH